MRFLIWQSGRHGFSEPPLSPSRALGNLAKAVVLGQEKVLVSDIKVDYFKYIHIRRVGNAAP